MRGMGKKKGNRCHCNRRRPGRNEVGGRMTGRYNFLRAERNIFRRRSQERPENERKQVREEKEREKEKQRDRKGRSRALSWRQRASRKTLYDGRGSIHPWSSTLSPSLVSLLSSPSLCHPHPTVQGCNPEVRPRRIIDSAQGRRIYSDEDFSGRTSNFNAPLPLSIPHRPRFLLSFDRGAIEPFRSQLSEIFASLRFFLSYVAPIALYI